MLLSIANDQRLLTATFIVSAAIHFSSCCASRCSLKIRCNSQVEREKERQRLQLLQARQLAAQAEAAAVAARAAAAALSGLDAAQGDGEPADTAQAGAAADLAAAPDRKRRRSEPYLASADHVQSLRCRARTRMRPDGHDPGAVFSSTSNSMWLWTMTHRGEGLLRNLVLPCLQRWWTTWR